MLMTCGTVGVAVKRSNLSLLEYLVPGAEPLALAPDEPGSGAFGNILAFHPDIIICPLKNPTEFDIQIFQLLSSVERVALSVVSDPDCPAPLAITQRREQIRKLANISVPVQEWEPETAAYMALWQTLTELGDGLPSPRITLTAAVREEAAHLLGNLGITPGQFAILCPAGTSSVPFKLLQPRAAAAIVAGIEHRFHLPTLLVGVEAEAQHVNECAAACHVMGAAPRTWLGNSRSLGTFLGVIANARILVGIDSAPIHFAAALGIPVVGIYGGGTFGRFTPQSDHAIVVHRPLPCYRCSWECWVGKPLCLEIDPDHLFHSIVGLLDSESGGPLALLPQPQGDGEALRDLLNQLHHTISEINADREARLRVILETQREAAELRQRLDQVKAEREARLSVILESQREAAELRQELIGARAEIAGRIGRQLRLISVAGYELTLHKREVIT